MSNEDVNVISIEKVLKLSQDIMDTLIDGDTDHSCVKEDLLISVISDFVEDELSEKAQAEIFDEIDSYNHKETYEDLEQKVELLDSSLDTANNCYKELLAKYNKLLDEREE